jgi:hypothetical protein
MWPGATMELSCRPAYSVPAMRIVNLSFVKAATDS